jgi:hypothetical protein
LKSINTYISGDIIKENEMGEACGTYGGEGKDRKAYFFLGGKLKGRDRLEGLGLDWRIILK